MRIVPDRDRLALPLFLLCLMLLLPACKDDLCQSQPPAMEVTVTLGAQVKARAKEIKSLQIDVTAKTFHRIWSFQITDELADGEASFAVALGPAGANGFEAKVTVRATDAKKEEVARGQKTFPGNSGDACNFRTLELGAAAVDGGGGDAGDGGTDLGADAGDSGPDISDVGTDRSPDQKKPDMLPDATPPDLCPSGDFAGSKKTCTKKAACDDKLACTVDICGGCVCYNAVKVGRCLIGGACYTTGEINPKNTCQRCEPSSSATGWAYFSAPGCVTTLAGQGINGYVDGPAASSRFNSPHGVAAYKNGSVYVTDRYNNMLRVVDKVGNVKTVVKDIYGPYGVDVDDFWTIYVAQYLYHQIWIKEDGKTPILAGKALIAGSVDGNALSAATFNTPTDVAVDSTGKAYVADHGNHLIRVIEKKNGKYIVSTMAGTGKAGFYNAKGTAATFNGPQGVAVDNKGYLYVADHGNHVIRRISIESGEVTTLAGSGVSGYFNSSDATSAQFHKPMDIALDNTGKVYVSDHFNHVIRVIKKNEKGKYEVSLLAGTAKKFGFADGEALSAKFNYPGRLTVDAFGLVHLADPFSHKIRTINTGGYWVAIKAGTFSMGSTPSEPCRNVAVEFKHDVTLTHGIEILATEVTQDQFYTVMGYEPSFFKNCGGTCPVENVNWHEAVAYCNALSTKAGKTPCFSCKGSGTSVTCTQASPYTGTKIYNCPGYRLPTEAEWEYAYRAGSKTAYYIGSGKAATCTEKEPTADKIGWNCYNSQVAYAGGKQPKCSSTKFAGPHPVGAKLANDGGLYDMAGNVWEWCHDKFKANLGYGTVIDPVEGIGSYTVIRGGAWESSPATLRAAGRGVMAMGNRNNNLGFRCVRTTK